MEANYTVYTHQSPDGKVYVGATSLKPEYRWNCGYKCNPRMQKALQTYPWEQWKHTIIETGLNKEEASMMEAELIDAYNLTNPEYGYNIQGGGLSRFEVPDELRQRRGKAIKDSMTSEVKAKMSKSQKGKNTWIKGRRHYNNGIKSVMAYECPEGFVSGRLPFKKNTME